MSESVTGVVVVAVTLTDVVLSVTGTSVIGLAVSIGFTVVIGFVSGVVLSVVEVPEV